MKKTFRRALLRGLEPHILFPGLAVLVIAIIWGTTFAYLRMQDAGIERASQVSTRDNVETCEAQVVSACQ